MTAVFFLLASVLIRCFWHIRKPACHWLWPVLTLALPFAAGGFHTGTAAVLSLVILIALMEQLQQHQTLFFFRNRSSAALLILLGGYCLTPLWAANRGMAAFGFVRYLPLVLFMLFLMQGTREEQHQALDLVPACGCIMTVLSFLVLLFPGLGSYVTVNGRLAGFFQYPNSYAAFLLAGLILLNTQKKACRTDLLSNILLVTGIVLSGSKTVFVLMCVTMVILCRMCREARFLLTMAFSLLCGMALGLLTDQLDLLHQADRFTDIHMASGSFLVRLLYFWDAIPAIAAHPFGIGYMGYPAIEGTIQTGRYYVSFLHNGLLQLLLEIGWIPGLLMAYALLRGLFSRETHASRRLLLLALLAHCMLDFDLQFPVFWILVLSCLELHSGKKISIPFSRLGYGLAALLAAVSLWLGCGDWLYRAGKTEACLRLTPFHTEAMTEQLSGCSDANQLNRIADRILALNPTHSLACSAKANAAFAAGDVLSMIRFKEEAIRCSPYTTEEYLDYFEKLYTAMQMYLQAGDADSARFCRDRLLQIPEMMADVSQNTHPLADLTGDDSSLVLPPAYQAALQQLSP